jgi:enamine deaminase RidA (YjgF/YER057c/UK114 family)
VADFVRVTPGPGISMAVRAGSLITVAGQVAWGLDDDVVGEDDSRAQSELVFANLSQVLAQVGADLSHVVKLTCFLTDAAHFDGYAAAKAAIYPDGGPASTTVVVRALLDPRNLVEVEAIAVLDEH